LFNGTTFKLICLAKNMEVIMENKNMNPQGLKNQSGQNQQESSGNKASPQGNIGNAGREGTQAYNNGNEGTESNRGKEESGAFDKSRQDDYEGGNLGTAGSGALEIPSAESIHQQKDQQEGSHTPGKEEQSNLPKVPVPVEKEEYEGGNLGMAGSGGMDISGSETSKSVDALSDENTRNKSDEGDKESSNTSTSRNPHGLGTGPAAFIPDGSEGGAKQPKEHTGKDTEMGGATGGTEGLGTGNSNPGIESEGVGNKEGSESSAGGGGSSAGTGK
jgi:hypothetical protein